MLIRLEKHSAVESDEAEAGVEFNMEQARISALVAQPVISQKQLIVLVQVCRQGTLLNNGSKLFYSTQFT